MGEMIPCEGCGNLREWEGSKCLTVCACAKRDLEEEGMRPIGEAIVLSMTSKMKILREENARLRRLAKAANDEAFRDEPDWKHMAHITKEMLDEAIHL